jgi:hypothetical protein
MRNAEISVITSPTCAEDQRKCLAHSIHGIFADSVCLGPDNVIALPAHASREERVLFNEEDFEELLYNENNDLDLERIREASRFGIPQSLRSEVWKLLFGISKLDKSEDSAFTKKIRDDFTMYRNTFERSNVDISSLKKIRGELSRVFVPEDFFLEFESNRMECDHGEYTLQIRERVESLVLIYLKNNLEAEYSPRLVHLLLPLLYVFRNDHDFQIYEFFCRLIDFIDEYVLSDGIDNVLAEFTMLFHSFHSDLCEAFESEGLYGVNEWALDLFTGLLSKELHLSNVVRLWDTYFSSFDAQLLDSSVIEDANMSFAFDSPKLKRNLSTLSSSSSMTCSSFSDRAQFGLVSSQYQHLHLYVILAILESSKESLIEYEYSEIKAFFQNLPSFDIDQLIAQAYNLRDSSKDLLSP